jgi:hypothetical protein
MQKKYEVLAHDSVVVGQRRLFRIRAVRDFADIRRGDIGGYIECEANLCHFGNAWVHDVAQVYGPGAVVRDNARVRGEAWVLGRVEDHAEVCDLVVIGEGACVGGRTILCGDEIVGGEASGPVEASRPAVSATAASWFGRQRL